MSKPKEPWKPIKPKQAIVCRTCKGSGKVYIRNYFSFSSYVDVRNCITCGGRGYL